MMHEQVERNIAKLFERGGLSAEQHGALIAHIRDCAQCERTYERYAGAERALYSGHASDEPVAASFDRVRARLLDTKPPPERRAPWLGALALTVAAAATAFIVIAPTPDDGMLTRGTQETLTTAYGLRLLRVRTNDDGSVDVSDASSVTIAPGDVLKVLYSTGEDGRFAAVRFFDAEGEMVSEVGPIAVDSNAVEQKLEGTIEVTRAWTSGRTSAVAYFSTSSEDIDPTERKPADHDGVWVRVVQTRVEERQ